MSTVKLTFQVSDDGTLKVIDDAGASLINLGKSAETGASQADRALSAIKKSAAAAAAAVGTAVAASVYLVKTQIDQVDNIGLLSRNLGIPAKELSGFTVAAKLANVELDGLGKGLSFFLKRVQDARQNGPSAKLFADLGLDVRSGRSALDVIYDVSDAFSTMEDRVKRVATARALFSRNGVQMIEMLAGGSEELRKQIELAERLGLTFTDLDGILADKFNDNLELVWMSFQGMARTLGVAFLPLLVETTEQVVDFAVANREVVSADLKRYVTELTPAIRNMADAAILGGKAIGVMLKAGRYVMSGVGMVHDMVVDPLLDDFAYLMTPDQTVYGQDPNGPSIQQQVNRRLYRGGYGDLGDLPGRMSSMVNGVGGVYTGDTIAPNVAEATERAAEAAKRFEEHMAGGAVSTKKAAVEADTLAASINEDLLFTLGKIEQGNLLGEYFADAAVQGEAAAVTISDAIIDEIERAEVAVIDLGELLGSSLTSAVDNLIASGKFDLADVFVATGRTITSRMVGGVLEGALSGITIPANPFAGFSGFGGKSAGTARVGGEVTGGIYGGGMSFDPSSGGFMTDATTGEAVFVSSGAAATVGSGFDFAGALGGGFAGVAVGGSIGSMIGLNSKESQVGTAIGGAAGLAAGAAIGSIIPGVGTVIGAMIGGLVGSLGGGGLGSLFESKPNKDQATRMTLDEAFKGAGIFPTLALAKEPPTAFKYAGAGRADLLKLGSKPLIQAIAVKELLASGQIRPAKAPDYTAGYVNDLEALGVMLGLEGSQVDEKIGRNLGIRADILGIDSAQFKRELQDVAQSVTTLPEALWELNASFLRNAIDGKDASFTLNQYNDRLESTIRLLVSDLPVGVNAVAIAFENVDRYAENSVVNIDSYVDALERAVAIASGLQSGIRGAGTAAVTGLLTGATNPAKTFRDSILQSALGGLGENILNEIFDQGSMGALVEGITEAVLSGDPEAIQDALGMVGAAFDQVQSAIARFIPVFEELGETVNATSYTLAEARGGRKDVLATIQRLKFGAMSAPAQEGELSRLIGTDKATISDLMSDGIIDASERARYDTSYGRLTSNAESLFALGKNYAAGSVQQRNIQQAALDALNFAAASWDAVIQNATVGDMSVTNVNVTNLIIDNRAAVAMLRNAARDAEGRQIIKDAAAGV